MRFPSRAAAFLFTSLLLVAPRLLAQAPAKPAPPPSDPYAGESYIIDHLDSLTVMNPDGTGYRQRSVAVKIQSDAALRELGVVSVPFASASEHVDFTYVRVRRPDGSVSDTPFTDALEQPEAVTREAPMYSDLKEKQLPVKNLRVGDTLEWQARITRTKAEAPGQFWGLETFVDGIVIRSETFELRVPKGTAVTVWTNPKSSVTPTESDAGTQHIYHWEHSALKPTTGKEADAEKEARKKKLWTADQELDAREGALPSLAWTTFKSWDAVGAWFRALEADRTAPDDAVKAKVAELTAGKTTEEEKVRAVYNYVSTQIRYIGVDLGVGRYQPHHASDVLENQYGDCKDKQTLLAAMLHVLGISSDAVLIGVGVRFNQAVPSPAAFNHVITHFQLAGNPVWLDATPEVMPFRMLMYGTRDKQTLVIPETGTARIERSPANPPFDSFQTWTSTGSLDKTGTSESRITWSLRGDQEVALRLAMRQVPPARYDELAQRMSAAMGYGGTTSHVVFSNLDDTSKPITAAYDYHREKAGDWDNLKTVAQLAPISLPMVDEKEPPVQSINLGFPRTETAHSEMKLPEGWGAELPEAIHEKTAFATYDATYKLDKGTLYGDRKLVILQEFVPATDWKIYKKWQEAVGLGGEPYIQLTRSVGSSGEKLPIISVEPATRAPSNPEAAKLVQQAWDVLLLQHNVVKATPLLEQAEKLNPQEKSLRGAFGYAALLKREPQEAIRYFRRELALYPLNFWIYKQIVNAELQLGKHDDAIQTLRDWAALEIGNPAPYTQLINLLLEDGHPADAADAGNAALAALAPDQAKDEALQLAIGKAQLKAGLDAKGDATLKTLIENTSDPNTMNSAAYELADAHHDLPLAESSIRAALDKLTAESKTWTLNESPTTLQQKSAVIAASWDTLGWILFTQGKFDQAQDYIEAAWLSRPNPVVGEHLGDAFFALGKYTDAITHYQLADEALQRHTLSNVANDQASTTLAHLAEKIAKAKKAGGKAILTDSALYLQQRRTIALGPARGVSGVAEYKLLIAHGKIQLAEPATPKTVPGATGILEKANLLRFTPKDSDTRIVRVAILNCHAATCDLILE